MNDPGCQSKQRRLKGAGSPSASSLLTVIMYYYILLTKCRSSIYIASFFFLFFFPGVKQYANFLPMKETNSNKPEQDVLNSLIQPAARSETT